MNDGSSNDNAAALQEERSAKSAACFRPYEAGVGEEEAPAEEGRDRGEGFEPAIRVVVGLPRGSEGEEYRVSLGWELEVEPKEVCFARYLPVCIETKHVHELYALLSQRPDTKQHAIMGISACLILISAWR